MVTIQGTIKVITISGRNGDFNVGTLVTEIGTFSVKDPELEQYEPGRYEGSFGFEHIHPTSYYSPAKGTTVVETRARIGMWSLDDIDPLHPEDNVPSTRFRGVARRGLRNNSQTVCQTSIAGLADVRYWLFRRVEMVLA